MEIHSSLLDPEQFRVVGEMRFVLVSTGQEFDLTPLEIGLLSIARTHQQVSLSPIHFAGLLLPGESPWTEDSAVLMLGGILLKLHQKLDLGADLSNEEEITELLVGDLRIDLMQKQVFKGGTPVQLTAVEFKILAYLARNMGRVCSPVEILYASHDFTFSKREAQVLVKVYVRRIRLQIKDDPNSPKIVVNVRGFGYKLDASNSEDSEIVTVGDLRINLRECQVFRGDAQLVLTPVEFQTLAYLAKNVGRVCSPVEILKAVQDDIYSVKGAQDTVKVYIRRLRKKIEPNTGVPIYIVNVRGFGYMFAGPEAAA